MTSYPKVPSSSFLKGHIDNVQKDAYGFFLNSHRQYGDALKLNAYNVMPLYSFTHPEAMQHILVKERNKFSHGKRWEDAIRIAGGDGMIVMRGQKWKERRQLLLPFFQTRRMESYVNTITESTLSLLREHNEKGTYTVNIFEVMERLAFYNIGHLLFGYNLQSEPDSIRLAMKHCFNTASKFMQYPLSVPLCIPTKDNRFFHKQLQIVDDLAYRIIEHARNEDADNMINELIASDGINDREIRDEVITTMLGGYETISTGLTWFWYLMAQNPDVARDIQDELKSVLSGDMPSLESMKKLDYTKMALSEALRLYPAVWGVSRYAEEADNVLGHGVKKGGQIVLPFFVTHRDPDFWEKPDEFFPEHFNEQATSKRSKHAYIPFGSGERVCIGRQLGWMEMMLIISVVLQYATPTQIVKGKDVKPQALFTLRPDRDIILVFEKA